MLAFNFLYFLVPSCYSPIYQSTFLLCENLLNNKPDSDSYIKFTAPQSQLWKRHKHREAQIMPSLFHTDFSNNTPNYLVSSWNYKARCLLIAAKKSVGNWAKPEHLKYDLWERKGDGGVIQSWALCLVSMLIMTSQSITRKYHTYTTHFSPRYLQNWFK